MVVVVVFGHFVKQIQDRDKDFDIVDEDIQACSWVENQIGRFLYSCNLVGSLIVKLFGNCNQEQDYNQDYSGDWDQDYNWDYVSSAYSHDIHH